MQDIKHLLEKTSLKITPQRLAILKVIDSYGHIGIDDIYNEIKEAFPSMSLATIYKNINTLKEANILSEIHPRNQKSKYEIKKAPHGHFVCKKCGEMYDFEIETSCNPNLDIIDDIQESEVYLYGVCKRCKG
jgi:Fe2+ or Zn2+ uptake regulation protein